MSTANSNKSKRKKYEGIIIDIEHAEEINEVIAKAEKNRRSRLIGEVYGDGYKTVAQAVEILSKRYYAMNKAELEGCSWRYDHNHQDFPNAYKFIPESTQLLITFVGGKWRLLKVSREITMPNSYSFVAVTMTEAFKEGLIRVNTKF